MLRDGGEVGAEELTAGLPAGGFLPRQEALFPLRWFLQPCWKIQVQLEAVSWVSLLCVGVSCRCAQPEQLVEVLALE